MSAFEAYIVSNCQGMEVITDILDDGYVRMRIPDAGIDVEYNPLSQNADTWDSDWYAPRNSGKTWN